MTGTEEKAKPGQGSFFTRDSKLILLSVLLNSIPIGYMNVIPAVYLLEVGLSAAIVGEIYAASAISNTIGLTPFGFLADRYGRKMFLLVGSFIPAISYVIFALTLNSNWLIVASVIGGVGVAGGFAVAISGPALLPLLASSTSDRGRTTLFGATQAAWTISLSIGALLSYLPGFLIRYLSEPSFNAHALSYYLMALLAAASAIPVIFIKEKREKSSVRTRQEEVKQIEEAAAATAPIVQRRSVASWIIGAFPRNTKRRIPIASFNAITKFTIVYALAGLGFGVILQILPSWYYLQFGTPESTAGLWIGIADMASIPTILAIPWLVRTRGTLYITVVFGFVATLFLGLMPLSAVFVVSAIFYVFRNIFSNISWPVLQSYMMGVVPEKERATTTGIATAGWGLANAVGTLVGGTLFAYNLLYLPFVIGVIGYVGSSAALWIFFRGVKPPEEAESSEQEDNQKT